MSENKNNCPPLSHYTLYLLSLSLYIKERATILYFGWADPIRMRMYLIKSICTEVHSFSSPVAASFACLQFTQPVLLSASHHYKLFRVECVEGVVLPFLSPPPCAALSIRQSSDRQMNFPRNHERGGQEIIQQQFLQKLKHKRWWQQ